ncbi:hypothetical protein CU098_012417 [Rhizopus stolonifer]|uniref:RRM domain-containing protein n=1 Tax=Rhizopus stolonifer TaxID=4846 RepID=A0A367KW35_RHIST|nr:hypothetical protein CU098_012417 [Rhizopus stolonifer]
MTWTMHIPQEPSPTLVLVKRISLQSSEKTVKEFFLFCGNILEFEMIKDSNDPQHQMALIHFERESAAKTATLLSHALIDECHIVATPYVEYPEQETQDTKPKTHIIAEILANGYILQDQVVAKGLEYDHKYNLSSRFTSYLNTLTSNMKHIDAKYRIWNKACDIEHKYKIHETVQSTAQLALQSSTGQKVEKMATQTLAQIAAVHYEAKKIQHEKITT